MAEQRRVVGNHNQDILNHDNFTQNMNKKNLQSHLQLELTALLKRSRVCYSMAPVLSTVFFSINVYVYMYHLTFATIPIARYH